MFEFLEE